MSEEKKWLCPTCIIGYDSGTKIYCAKSMNCVSKNDEGYNCSDYVEVPEGVIFPHKLFGIIKNKCFEILETNNYDISNSEVKGTLNILNIISEARDEYYD